MNELIWTKIREIKNITLDKFLDLKKEKLKQIDEIKSEIFELEKSVNEDSLENNNDLKVANLIVDRIKEIIPIKYNKALLNNERLIHIYHEDMIVEYDQRTPEYISRLQNIEDLYNKNSNNKLYHKDICKELKFIVQSLLNQKICDGWKTDVKFKTANSTMYPYVTIGIYDLEKKLNG